MAGTITKRGKDTWRIRIAFGTDSTGKRRTFSKTIHGSKKDADAFLTAKLREKDLGTFIMGRHGPAGQDLVRLAFGHRWVTELATTGKNSPKHKRLTRGNNVRIY